MKKLIIMLACCAALSNVQAAVNPVDQQDFANSKLSVLLTNGTRIAYVESGNPNGPPILLIHGYTDNARSWSLMTPYLNQKYRIISMDLRGHGKSSTPECCYTLQDLSYDAKLLLDKLGIEKAIVVGHSLGSMVTQVLAERFPERVSKVVLISSTSETARVSDANGWLATEIGKLQQPIDPNSQFMLDWYTNPNEVNAEFLEKERNESAAVPVNVWRSILVETQTSEFGRQLKYLYAPALIMHGSKDPLFDGQDQENLKLGLPTAKFIEFPNQGHNIMWEEPKSVAEAINAFISN